MWLGGALQEGRPIYNAISAATASCILSWSSGIGIKTLLLLSDEMHSRTRVMLPVESDWTRIIRVVDAGAQTTFCQKYERPSPRSMGSMTRSNREVKNRWRSSWVIALTLASRLSKTDFGTRAPQPARSDRNKGARWRPRAYRLPLG